MASCHIVWDWNGTLLDDLSVILMAANAALGLLGGGPVDAEGYRTHYVRPVRLFYERVLGRALSDAEWTATDDEFRRAYAMNIHHASLALDALETLEVLHRAESCSQSILSMWWHDELQDFADRYDVVRYMSRVDGNVGISGAGKQAMLERHLQALASDGAPAEVVVIGDSLDDALAARAAGVRCVLYNGGSHHRHELESTGAPVADTLLSAIRLTGLL